MIWKLLLTAKRCGLSVTVDDKDGKRIVKLAGHPTDDVIARLKVLSASDRLKVFESFDAATGAYVLRPASRPATVRHFLTHTSGLAYPFTSTIWRDYKPRAGETYPFGGPLLFDPGERWEYGISIDWVGQLVEAASGSPLVPLDDILGSALEGGMAEGLVLQSVQGRKAMLVVIKPSTGDILAVAQNAAADADGPAATTGPYTRPANCVMRAKGVQRFCSSGSDWTACYLNFRGLPEPMTWEVAWIIHRYIELGRFIRIVDANAVFILLRAAIRHGDDECRSAQSLLHRSPDEWVRSARKAQMLGEKIGEFAFKEGTYRLGHMVAVLGYAYHRGPWWELNVWNPSLDPRVPQRDHEPIGSTTMHFTNLTSLWMREGAKYWLSAGLSAERYSWSTIKSRLDALKWLQRYIDTTADQGLRHRQGGFGKLAQLRHQIRVPGLVLLGHRRDDLGVLHGNQVGRALHEGRARGHGDGAAGGAERRVGPDAERAIERLARSGCAIIFTTSFGFMDPTIKVAEKFPDVKFEHATGYKQAENMRTYDSRTYEGAYMAGVIAGKMTKSNTLGVVASIPIPEVVRNINSFTLGAQSSNPKVKTKVVWVNEWFNPPKETEAATSLINGGADVLFQNTDSPAVLKTAQDKGKRAFGWDSDMTAYGPKAHLASAIINWTPYYIKATQEALEGKWTGGSAAWWGVKEGAIDIVSIAEDVPADTKAKVEEVKKGLKEGSFAIWKGPILDNTGKEVLKKDEVADDKFLGGINFYVKGVEGKVPGGDKK